MIPSNPLQCHQLTVRQRQSPWREVELWPLPNFITSSVRTWPDFFIVLHIPSWSLPESQPKTQKCMWHKQGHLGYLIVENFWKSQPSGLSPQLPTHHIPKSAPGSPLSWVLLLPGTCNTFACPPCLLISTVQQNTAQTTPPGAFQDLPAFQN